MSAAICPSKAVQAGLSSRALESPAATAGASVSFSSAPRQRPIPDSFLLQFGILGYFLLVSAIFLLDLPLFVLFALKHDRL